MNRIDAAFQALRDRGRKAFIAYVTAGDPDFEGSLAIIRALADAGADVIELGVPFSDPLADGIVNQMAAERALRSGMSTHRLLDLIRSFRTTHSTPLVIFTYLNPVFAHGFEKFHADAAAAGADGVLLLDLPPDEARLHAEFSRTAGLHSIRLIAPTTPDERIPSLMPNAGGFIYALSRTGVTGGHVAPSEHIAEQVARITPHTSLPVCVGFGISNPEQAALVARHSEGAIVGSALVKQIELHPEAPAEAVKKFATPLIQAVHAV